MERLYVCEDLELETDEVGIEIPPLNTKNSVYQHSAFNNFANRQRGQLIVDAGDVKRFENNFREILDDNCLIENQGKLYYTGQLLSDFRTYLQSLLN